MASNIVASAKGHLVTMSAMLASSNNMAVINALE